MFETDFKAIQPVPFAAMVRDPAPGKTAERQTPRRAFLARAHRRRFAALRAAADILATLPEEGESIHGLMTGLYDLMHLLIVLLQRLDSPCLSIRIGTLSLSRRNVQEMVALLDDGRIARLDVLVSHFFSKHDDDIFTELAQELHARGQRVAVARSHAKVITLALEDGRRYVLEGSANLRTNHNIEQLCLSQCPELFTFYDMWLQDMVTANEINQSNVPKKS